MTGTGTPDPAVAARTRLAWRRTALAATVVTLLALRMSIHSGQTWDLLGGGLALLIWLAVTTVSQRRIAALDRHRPAPIGAELPSLALLVAGYAIIGAVLVVLG